MKCNEVNGLLDLLMDGELNDEQRQAMEAHGRQCPECAAAIHSTLQMKALFEQLEPEVDVPLEAQARWRGAVRQAAKPQKPGQLRRWIASVAAAAVVLVGVGAALVHREAPKQNATAYEDSAVAPMALEERAAEPALASGVASNGMAVDAPGAVVEADGMADEAVAIGDAAMGLAAESEAAALSAPACELALRVKDVETACDRIRDLAQEYEAVADVQAAVDGGANVYVEIDAENARDFLNAVAPLDASGKTVGTPELAGSGRLLVLLALTGQ
jgi:hypothetical protein